MSLQAARHLNDAERPELAERELRRWLSRHPDDAEAHALLGCVLAKQRLPGAEEEALEAVRLAPEWAYPHVNLAWVCLRLRRTRRAERAARAALEIDPEHLSALALLASALLNQPFRRVGREALRVAEAGLALDPGSADCARLRAQALHRLGRRAEAREAAAFALRLAPGESATHAATGWIELTSGNARAARRHIREALRLDPVNNPEAERALRILDDGDRFPAVLLLAMQAGGPLLRGAAALHAALVAAAVVVARGDALPYLAGSLAALLYLEIFTLRGRFAAAGRQWLAELRATGEISRRDRNSARGFLAVMVLLSLIAPALALFR